MHLGGVDDSTGYVHRLWKATQQITEARSESNTVGAGKQVGER